MQTTESKKNSQPPKPTIVPTSPEQYLTVRDLAALLRRSVSGTWLAVSRGELPQPYRWGNRCSRWKWGEVEASLNKNR